jgi:hypothetical protein
MFAICFRDLAVLSSEVLHLLINALFLVNLKLSAGLEGNEFPFVVKLKQTNQKYNYIL